MQCNDWLEWYGTTQGFENALTMETLLDRLMMERNVAREFRRKSQPHLFGETHARQ